MKYLSYVAIIAIFICSCSESAFVDDGLAKQIETRSLTDAEFEAIEDVFVHLLAMDTTTLDSINDVIQLKLANSTYNNIFEVWAEYGVDSIELVAIHAIDTLDLVSVWNDSTLVVNQDFEDDYTDYIKDGKSIMYEYNTLTQQIEIRWFYSQFTNPCSLGAIAAMTVENAASASLMGAAIVSIPASGFFGWLGAGMAFGNIAANMKHLVTNCKPN